MSETLDRPCRGARAVGTPPTGSSGAIMRATSSLDARSRFEAMARLSEERPRRVGDVLDALLDPAHPHRNAGCALLEPLWVEETMHRAYSLMRLAGVLNRIEENGDRGASGAGTPAALARDLAGQFRLLACGHERQDVPCSPVLREITTGLCALFGSAANIALKLNIESLTLPMYKRRALVLAAAELVINALLHGFRGRNSGRIEVSLTSCEPMHGCLRVADNGVGFIEGLPNLGCGVAAGLAGVLKSGLTYKRAGTWTTAQIRFSTDPRSQDGA